MWAIRRKSKGTQREDGKNIKLKGRNSWNYDERKIRKWKVKEIIRSQTKSNRNYQRIIKYEEREASIKNIRCQK